MKFIWSYCISFSLLCCLFFSCENEESLIGENFLMNGDHEVFILSPDSIIISAMTQFEDSVSAQNSTNLVGSYYDSYFGQTDATFYFEITLPNNELSFNATAVTNATTTAAQRGTHSGVQRAAGHTQHHIDFLPS